jgi:hypothetical protein
MVKAIGFEVNEGNERMVGRSRLHGGSATANGLWAIVEAHPDGNFSSSAFGSYLDSVPFLSRVRAPAPSVTLQHPCPLQHPLTLPFCLRR